MKQKIYSIGLITTLVIFTGTIFKVNHLPGAGILLTIGIFSVVVIFLSLALINHYRSKGTRQSLLLYWVTWLTCFVVFTAMLFKLMHWPGAGLMLLIALPFPYVVFLPVFIIVTSKNKNFSIYNTVIVLFLLASNSVFSTLLALNVSKTRIDDSLQMAINYNRLETVLRDIPGMTESESVPGKQSTLIQKADDLLNLVNDCQSLLYKYVDTSEEEWIGIPGTSRNIDSRQVAQKVMFAGNEPQMAVRLEAELRGFINELEKTPGYSELAILAHDLFELSEPKEGDRSWAGKMFGDNYLSWVLIYLDSLEVNVLSLKAEIASM